MRPALCFLPALFLSSNVAPGQGLQPLRYEDTTLDGKSTLIPVQGPRSGERNEVFDLQDSDDWFKPAPMDPERTVFRNALAGRLGEEGIKQRKLMERQYNLYRVQTGKPGQRESENGRMVLDGRAGKPRPVNVMEWRLLQHQAHRFPLIEHPTEFSAFILRGHGRIHAYMTGGDSIGVKIRQEVMALIEQDLKNGWTILAQFHNHPFMFDRIPGDRMFTTEDSRSDIGGALAPSLADVQMWRRLWEALGLQATWVTNGLDSYQFDSEDFNRLSAWE
jgi:hypothetical protein